MAAERSITETERQNARAIARQFALPWYLFAAALALATWLGWQAYGPEDHGDPVATSLTAFEKANTIEPVPGYTGVEVPPAAAAQPVPLNPVDHPCHAPELHIALACWQALFADAGEAGQQLKKADVLRWLAEQHADLGKTAAERIATVVLPAKK